MLQHKPEQPARFLRRWRWLRRLLRRLCWPFRIDAFHGRSPTGHSATKRILVARTQEPDWRLAVLADRSDAALQGSDNGRELVLRTHCRSDPTILDQKIGDLLRSHRVGSGRGRAGRSDPCLDGGYPRVPRLGNAVLVRNARIDGYRRYDRRYVCGRTIPKGVLGSHSPSQKNRMQSEPRVHAQTTCHCYRRSRGRTRIPVISPAHSKRPQRGTDTENPSGRRFPFLSTDMQLSSHSQMALQFGGWGPRLKTLRAEGSVMATLRCLAGMR